MQQVRNDSGETIPAFAVMRVTGVVEVKQETIFTVDQQDTSDAPVLINGPTPIPDGEYGVIQPGPIFAAYFDSAASPAVGDELGSEDGEWKLTTAGSGWVFLGALTDEAIGLFRQEGGGSDVAAIANGDVDPGASGDFFLADASFSATADSDTATNDSAVTIPSGTKCYLGKVSPLPGKRVKQAFMCSDPA